jgi:hypothetical protein
MARSVNRHLRIAALIAALALVASVALAAPTHTSGPFQGAKANKGTVMHMTENGKSMLTLSDDFVVPDTPDPHWQLVDSKGNVYLLDRLPLKGDKVARSIEVPPYVHDVAKVQIWCVFAQTVLGEASFSSPVK